MNIRQYLRHLRAQGWQNILRLESPALGLYFVASAALDPEQVFSRRGPLTRFQPTRLSFLDGLPLEQTLLAKYEPGQGWRVRTLAYVEQPEEGLGTLYLQTRTFALTGPLLLETSPSLHTEP
jgi:hypothetical protein